ncbi:TonB-dependent receptor [Gynurincola endophyticus]|uniref:TonB-dependent receptor n=1 Tax=Gynurincola endophyticus TaxID=2479004 RepID=UPI000F8C58EB|nr:TonB-dependent receptor [Gynurincola endophyticus]
MKHYRFHQPKITFTFILVLFTVLAYAQETRIIEVSGKVLDEFRNPLTDVSVQVKNSVSGTTTNKEGNFQLRTRLKLPFTLVFSSIGFRSQEFVVERLGAHLEVQLETQSVLGDAVVVTASRVAESILKSPVAIEKLDIRAIRETPAPGFYDALANVKGVQMTTSSLTFKVPNTRGFNIPNNFRFMQMVDGVDMQAATLGVPLGNAIGPTELDIASVEITPGAASALYGMNAINGMANLLTKSPFTSQGLSVYHKSGVNHVDNKDRNASILTETAIRYAKAFNNKWAFKVNASFLRGTDWVSNTGTDQNSNNLNTANPAYPELNGTGNVAADLWNKYGDENNNAVTITGVNYQGRSNTFILRRTGYWEKDLVNPIVENVKFDAALHYRIHSNAEVSYSYRFGKMDGVFQRGNKIQLDDVKVQNHKFEVKGNNYIFRTYLSVENTGNSYNIKPLSDNLQLTHLSNNAWGTRFKAALQEALDNQIDLSTAMQSARLIADQGRVEPGTAAFDQLKQTIIGINNWDHVNAGIADAPATGGAWLLQKSRMYHSDFQWDFSNDIKWFDLLVGADLRIYEVIPDGNNFVDFSRPVAERNKPIGNSTTDFGKNVLYKKYGAFAQVTKTFFDEKLKTFFSLRFDHNLEFTPKVNPRIAVVYTLAEKHNLRLSYQNGFRFPALFEAISFVNNGNVRRVGGLSYINEGLGYLDNSYTLSSVNNFNAAYNRDRDPALASGVVDEAAALKNKNLLEVTNLAATRPERINSFEFGYKSVLLNNKLVFDIDVYLNRYDGFLGQVEVAVPSTDKILTDGAVIDMVQANRSKQTRYRVYTNAKNVYENYGFALGTTYIIHKTYTVSGNLSYNDIAAQKNDDIFINAFNTPKWVTNISFGNRKLTEHVGFNVVWRWQDAFEWFSPLANGKIAAFSTVDAQVSFAVPQLFSTIKVGGSNILNHRYVQYAAGPTIGALYYASITVDGLLK